MRQRQGRGKSREIPLLDAKPMALVGRCNDAVGARRVNYPFELGRCNVRR